MQMTLETLGQLERRLHVAVPKAQIEGEIHKRLAQLAKTAKVPGFRPGKVPFKMVAQQYGPQVRSDVISRVLGEHVLDLSQHSDKAIFEAVWGYDFGSSSNSLGVYMGYLRRKTEVGDEPRLLHTVRGVGYVLRSAP